MKILNQLATALNRRDEVPNQELAQRIVDSGDAGAVLEIVHNLGNRDKNIQNDCVKVLYEIGGRRPGLIAKYHNEILKLLDSSNNRLVWGAMTALDTIALEKPKKIFGMLPKILEAADNGSVITRDHAVGILVKLAGLKQYTETCLPLLMEQVSGCPNNQLAMYAEKISVLIDGKNKQRFQAILAGRLEGLEKDSQKRRLEKLLRFVEGTQPREAA